MTLRVTIYRLGVIPLLLILCLLAACSAQELEPDGGDRVNLKVLASATTRGEDGTAESLPDVEKNIYDLSVYIFDSNGKAITFKSEKFDKDYSIPKAVNISTHTATGCTLYVVANAIKDWAIEHGATHYTHWFQPMTGSTAEKHDSFISPTDNGMVIMNFSGKELVKGEPDASSFPSGGLRETCSARGYTAWDPTSYCFVKEGSLYIPTVFVSYTGEALDKKTPLLRSMDALSQQAVRILRLFGNTTATKVTSTVGPEQEYFLIDKKMYDKREDLIMTGRTLFGAMPPKGQELDDQYFANLKPRIAAYMADLDEALWRVGVFATTKHNEVAPAQHEMAPVFSTTNISTDQNELAMEVMEKVALKHGLVCLLHEKPFDGVNGSGKHNNWSMATNDGQNLLDPGSTPMENMQFLTFLCAIIKGIDEYADLLRISASSAGNDHRLGANEAPPAIISIFMGEELQGVLDALEAGTSYKSESKVFEIGVDALPDFPKDSTDRNRTSPFVLLITSAARTLC